MFDPIAGRFLEEDPADFAAGDPNLFRYVGNSPTNATDPSGLDKLAIEGDVAYWEVEKGLFADNRKWQIGRVKDGAIEIDMTGRRPELPTRVTGRIGERQLREFIKGYKHSKEPLEQEREAVWGSLYSHYNSILMRGAIEVLPPPKPATTAVAGTPGKPVPATPPALPLPPKWHAPYIVDQVCNTVAAAGPNLHAFDVERIQGHPTASAAFRAGVSIAIYDLPEHVAKEVAIQIGTSIGVGKGLQFLHYIGSKGWKVIKNARGEIAILTKEGKYLNDPETKAIKREWETVADRYAEMSKPRDGAMQMARHRSGTPRISTIAPDYVEKGVHIHVGGVELKVLPGEGGTVVFKPVFSSQEKTAGPAIKQAQSALADPAFRAQLHDVATRATDYLRQSGLPGAKAKASETHFLRIALEKMGLE